MTKVDVFETSSQSSEPEVGSLTRIDESLSKATCMKQVWDDVALDACTRAVTE